MLPFHDSNLIAKFMNVTATLPPLNNTDAQKKRTTKPKKTQSYE